MWYAAAKLLLFVAASASPTNAIVEFLSSLNFLYFSHSLRSTELSVPYVHQSSPWSDRSCDILLGNIVEPVF